MGKLPRFNLFTLPLGNEVCFVYTVSRLETSPFGDTFYLTTDKEALPRVYSNLPLFLTSCLLNQGSLEISCFPPPLHPAPQHDSD